MILSLLGPYGPLLRRGFRPALLASLLALPGVASAAVVATAPAPDADAVYAPRRVAVLVGVQEYGDPALAGLRFPAKDARDLGVALGSADVGGFDEVKVVTGAAATSRAALRQALRDATATLQRDDTFLLYLSGHGTLTLDPEGSHLWFLPSDGRLDAPEATGLSVAELEALVADLPARRRVLILDTCHNGRAGSKSSVAAGTAARLQGLRGEPPAPRVEREISESEARLYAAQYYQPAMEDPELQNGVYTHYLLEGLTGERDDADLDRDGLVDVAEAHEYARDRTIAWTGGLQVPRAEYRIVGREEIFLSGKEGQRSAAEQALVSATNALLNRARILVNGVPRGELPGLYAVDPGPTRIRVETADGRTLLDERVRLEAGATLPVEDLLRRRAPELSVALGASWQGGGAGAMHAVHPSLQVAWARPVDLGARWRPDLHASFEIAEGPLPTLPDAVATTGTAALGATLGLQVGPAWIGPTVEARLPFRVREDLGERQLQVTGAAGLSAGAGIPLGRSLALDLRADGWGSPYPYAGEWVPSWGGALRVGVAAR